MLKPRYRLATDHALHKGMPVMLRDAPAHYLTQVLRLRAGDSIALFSREAGEWRASLSGIHKKEVRLQVEEQLRAPETPRFSLTVCFCPIRGGRMETILEKATELGAQVLQPVLTQRTIVDKVNLERAEAILRESAEQCERLDWPAMRAPVKLLNLLGQWPTDLPLIYGDERGGGESIQHVAPSLRPTQWAVLAGPEGGFTDEEFAALRHLKTARAVSLGPRILRADTAIISLCVSTLMAWGDWDQHPRFEL